MFFRKLVIVLNPQFLQVWRLWESKSLLEVIDPCIREDCKSDEVTRYIHIGLLCVQENPAKRPTMSTIDQMLTTSSIALPAPLPPGFFFRNEPRSNPSARGLKPDQTSSKSITCSVDEATITDVNPRWILDLSCLLVYSTNCCLFVYIYEKGINSHSQIEGITSIETSCTLKRLAINT